MGCCLKKKKVFNTMVNEINKNVENIIKSPFLNNLNNECITNKYIKVIEKSPNEFFYNTSKEVLKTIPESIFTKLSKSCIDNLSLQTLLLLDNLDILKFFPKNFLNHISQENLCKLPEEFLLKYLKNSSEDLLIKIIKLIKFSDENLKQILNILNFSSMDQEKLFNLLKIPYVLEKLNLIGLKNYFALEQYFPLLDIEILERLKNCPFKVNFNRAYSSIENSSLCDDDILSSTITKSINELSEEDIVNKIKKYIFDENSKDLHYFYMENFYNERNKKIIDDYFSKVIKNGKNDLYSTNEKLIVLIVLARTNEKYYPEMVNMIKIYNEKGTERCNLDGLWTKIEMFSKIVREAPLDLDFKEMICEENNKNMEALIYMAYNGVDKNSIEPKLLEKQSEIIGDYLDVKKEKYGIDISILIERIEKHINKENNENKENKEAEIMSYVNSYFDKNEILFFYQYLKFLSIHPDLETYISSFANPIFKNIRNIVISYKAFSIICPFLGFTSTLLLGGALLSYNAKNIINDSFKKKFFSNEEYRKLYHYEIKLKEDTRFTIFIRKVKELYRYYGWPIIKKVFSYFDKYILKLEEKEKIGFERTNTDILKKSIELKRKSFENYISMKANNLHDDLYKIIEHMKNKLQKERNSNLSDNIIKINSLKKKIVENIYDKKKENLCIKYPEIKDDTFVEKSRKSFNGIWRCFWNVSSFGYLCNGKEKMYFSDLMDLFKKIECKKKRDLELDILEEEKKSNLANIVYEEVKILSFLSENDKKIFIAFDKMKKNEEKKLKYLKDMFFGHEHYSKDNIKKRFNEDSNENEETDDEEL